METKRTIQIVIENDKDLKATLAAFQKVCNAISPICFNNGKPIGLRKLHDVAYHKIKGIVCSQMTQTAIRLVAGCYTKKKRKKLTKPVHFELPFACFLVGNRGRDAHFCPEGTISIWTIAGRKKLRYHLPAHFKPLFDSATDINSILIKEREGKLIGYVCITLSVPEPKVSDAYVLVGVDRNETNPIVAIKETGEVFFEDGVSHKVWKRKHRKKMARLQRKLAVNKGQRRDTRSVRRRLQDLCHRQRNFTRTYCHTIAKQLVEWAGNNAILALEELHFPQGKKGSKACNRRLSQFPHRMLLNFICQKAEMRGIPILRDEKGNMVNPAYTSQRCHRCQRKGHRDRHDFRCHHCKVTFHADVNAAINILHRAQKLLAYSHAEPVGRKSVVPEAQPLLLWQGQGLGDLSKVTATY